MAELWASTRVTWQDMLLAEALVFKTLKTLSPCVVVVIFYIVYFQPRL